MCAVLTSLLVVRVFVGARHVDDLIRRAISGVCSYELFTRVKASSPSAQISILDSSLYYTEHGPLVRQLAEHISLGARN
jgi:hypothetical protein